MELDAKSEFRDKLQSAKLFEHLSVPKKTSAEVDLHRQLFCGDIGCLKYVANNRAPK